VVSPNRTEQEVLRALTDEERTLLKKVLQIERAKLHTSAYDPTEELLAAVKEILP
jgi:hypothetical protein